MSIAEGMINGELCHWCGVYNGEPEGYPCLCDDCFEEGAKEEGVTKTDLGLKILKKSRLPKYPEEAQ